MRIQYLCLLVLTPSGHPLVVTYGDWSPAMVTANDACAAAHFLVILCIDDPQIRSELHSVPKVTKFRALLGYFLL